MFITMFTRAFHWYLSWARLIQSIPPHPISLRYIFTLSTHLHLGLPSGLFPSGFPINILHAFPLLPHSCYMLAHLILLDFIILIISDEEYKLWSSSLCSFIQSPVTLHLSSVQIFFSAPCSNTLSLCSCLNVRDHVSHPYRTTGKIIGLYNLIFMFLDNRQVDIRFWTEW
jgi:hypothetical protein